MNEKLNSLKIRKMRPDDFQDIVEIDKKIVGKDRVTSWPQKVTSHIYTYTPYLCFVAEVDNNVVGFILGDMRGSEYSLPLSCWVDIVGIDPDYQRQGIGKKLINAFWEECQRNGVKMRIIVRESDENIINFLKSIGFHRGKLIDLEK